MNNYTSKYQNFLAGEHAAYQANIMKNDTIVVIKQITEKILPISDAIDNVVSFKNDLYNRLVRCYYHNITEV